MPKKNSSKKSRTDLDLDAGTHTCMHVKMTDNKYFLSCSYIHVKNLAFLLGIVKSLLSSSQFGHSYHESRPAIIENLRFKIHAMFEINRWKK